MELVQDPKGRRTETQEQNLHKLRRLVLRYVSHNLKLGTWAPLTTQQRRGVLLRFADVIDGRAINRRSVERWWTTTADLAPGTRRNVHSAVRRFLAWMVREGKLSRNPLDHDLPAPKVVRSVHRALDRDAAVAILAACPDQRARVIVTLGLQVGLRRAEIAGLEVGDISWASRTIKVTGKGGHSRYVPVTAELEAELQAYLRQQPATAGPLIRRQPGHGHGGLTPTSVGLIFRRAAEDAGVKVAPGDGVATHALRHTAATDVANRVADPRVVQELLGHQNLATTARYIASLPSRRLAEAVEGRSYGTDDAA